MITGTKVLIKEPGNSSLEVFAIGLCCIGINHGCGPAAFKK
jgi:hypothetical protein